MVHPLTINHNCFYQSTVRLDRYKSIIAYIFKILTINNCRGVEAIHGWNRSSHQDEEHRTELILNVRTSNSRMMEQDKENDFKRRPPRLPSNHHPHHSGSSNSQPLTTHRNFLNDSFNESVDRTTGTRSRSRGRSSSSSRSISNPGRKRGSSTSITRSNGTTGRSTSSKPHMSMSIVKNNHKVLNPNGDECSKLRHGKSRSVDSSHRRSTLSRSGSSNQEGVTSPIVVPRGRTPHDEDYLFALPLQAKHTMNINGASETNDHDHEDDVAYTPQVTRRRGSISSGNSKPPVMYVSVSNTDHLTTSHATNAPKKKIRTHSKQHVIKKQNDVENTEVKRCQRTRSHSRSAQQRRVGERPDRATRSTSSSGRIQTYSSEDIRRARSMSKTRKQGNEPASLNGRQSQSLRPRSHSRSSSIKDGTSRSRGNSLSSFDKQRRRSISRTRSVSSGLFAVEPNVHHNAIVETEIECPVIAEMKENELYAIRNGIDLLTLNDEFSERVEPGIEDMLLQDETRDDGIVANTKVRRNQVSQLSNNHEYPCNASFLCDGDGASSRIIGSNTDLEQLKTVAAQLCSGWDANEYETPSIARRIIDFNFAQMKRRKKYGNERPWGILGLYDHLSAVRMDVEWAEMAACRRANGEPYKAWFEFVDERGTGKNRPYFTISSLIVCSAFLLISIAANGWVLEPFSVNPMLGPSAETLVTMGAKESLLIVQKGEVWRIISAMVLHAGLIHFVLNMLALWFVGKAVEQCHGFFSSLLLFVVPGIGGTILSAIFLPNMVSVGASGGIFGLIGACLADIYMNWGLLFNKFVNRKNNHVHVYVLLALLVDVFVNSLIGLTPFVDNFTHLGGMIFGFICGTSTMQRISTDMFDGQEKEKTLWTSAKSHFFHFFGIILTLTIMIVSFTILMQGDGVTTPCRSCKVFSCVEFPPWASPSEKWWYCDECAGVTADARINPETKQFDRLSINCPYGDVFTLDIQNDMKADRDWLERQLPKW